MRFRIKPGMTLGVEIPDQVGDDSVAGDSPIRSANDSKRKQIPDQVGDDEINNSPPSAGSSSAGGRRPGRCPGP